MNSQIDLLKHPEKYCFNCSLASSMVEEDYIFSKQGKKFISDYKILKMIEKKYIDNSDENSNKIIFYNNKTL